MFSFIKFIFYWFKTTQALNILALKCSAELVLLNEPIPDDDDTDNDNNDDNKKLNN